MTACFRCVAVWLFLSGGVIAQTPPSTRATSPAAAATSVARPLITQGLFSAKVERVAPNRATVTVAPKLAGTALRLLDANGREVATTKAADGSIKAEIDTQRGYVLAPPPPARKPLPKEGLHLPARYLTFSPTGATNLGGLFLRPAVVPLTWSDQTKAYSTDLLVGYEFEDGREATLAAPKTVHFFAEGANARIQADTVNVTKSGGAGYQRVTLTTGQVDGETHFTARVSAADELKASVTVLREAGSLKLSLPATELPAFGVGSETMTVTLLGRDHQPIATGDRLGVHLSSRRLRQPAAVTIEAGKSSVTAEVRTTGYGRDEISAQSGSFRTTLPVEAVFPLAATIAAFLGGALGGATRYLRNKGRRGSLLVRRLLEGMLVGLIVVGAAWAGLVSADLSTGILGTPFGAFVLGALSGYLGCVVLDQIAKKTFGVGKAQA